MSDRAPPAVSVLLPTRDRASRVGVSIESVLKQSFEDFELILIDDGSRDNTGEVAGRFRDPRMRILTQDRLGLSRALNAGLAVARGRYVAQIDSDDAWLPHLLETQVAVLEAEPDAGLVYARAAVVDQNGQPTEEVWGGPLRWPDDPLASLLYNDPVCNITALKRRECIDRVGPFDVSLDRSNDWDLHIRIAHDFGVRFNDAVLAHIGRYGDNLTFELDEVLETRVRVLDKLFAQPDLPAAVQDMRPLAYSNLHAEHGIYHWSGGRYGTALRRFGTALALSDTRTRALARIAWFTLAAPLARFRARRRRRSAHGTQRRVS
jgi:glycosyltransferase involved in cell wall biosynthesis